MPPLCRRWRISWYAKQRCERRPDWIDRFRSTALVGPLLPSTSCSTGERRRCDRITLRDRFHSRSCQAPSMLRVRHRVRTWRSGCRDFLARRCGHGPSRRSDRRSERCLGGGDGNRGAGPGHCIKRCCQEPLCPRIQGACSFIKQENRWIAQQVRAKAMRCFSPPEKRWPRSPTIV